MNDKNETMKKIGKLIRTQDNRYTSHPIFLVQQKKRIWGLDSDYCTDYEWLDGCSEIATGYEKVGLDTIESRGGDIRGWRKVYYVDQWEFVTACFTEQACKIFIAARGHKLNEPRIYAASAYGNDEMIAIREMLISLK